MNPRGGGMLDTNMAAPNLKVEGRKLIIKHHPGSTYTIYVGIRNGWVL